MKETTTANIGGRSFTIDRDAYARLASYLNNVRSRITSDVDSTMNDIEARLADIFADKCQSPLMVVTLSMVESAIAQMGRPEDFGPECNRNTNTTYPKQLRRPRQNRSIAGVCSGIAEYFDLDPTAVRLITLLLLLCGGMSLWVYIIMWILIPEEE